MDYISIFARERKRSQNNRGQSKINNSKRMGSGLSVPQYKKIQIIQDKFYEQNSSEMGIYWIQAEQPVSTLPVSRALPAELSPRFVTGIYRDYEG